MKKINSKIVSKTTNVVTIVENLDEITAEDRKRSSAEKVTPLDFVNFIPWVCLQWNVERTVLVVRLPEEMYIDVEKRKPTITRHSKSSREHSKLDEISQSSNGKSAKHEAYNKLDYTSSLWCACKVIDKNTLVIQAYYNLKDQLVEISMPEHRFDIPRKVIRAFNLCLPFHPALTRLTIRKNGLNHHVIYEISKLLPHSNITQICLDDSYVPQGNYYILLQDVSKLSYLSLNRCMINDEVCKEIAKHLVFGMPAAKSLRVLSLASNNICDIGAQYLGNMLRTNVCLLHLNLAGNKITDDGAKALLVALVEFQLTEEEVLETKHRLHKHAIDKQEIHIKCMDEFSVPHKDDLKSESSIITFASSVKMIPLPKRISKKTKKPIPIHSDSAKDTILEPFCLKHAEQREGCYYVKGNFILSSLNLAYNHLHYPSLKILDNVVSYQHEMLMHPPATGLLRIVLDGNYLPETCSELERIDIYLKENCALRTTTRSSKVRGSSTNIKKKSARVSLDTIR